MTDLNVEDISGALLDFLGQQDLDLPSSIGPGSLLEELGIDSFTLIELVLFIERTFDTRIPLELLTPNRITSLDSLARLVVEISSS